jgi:uncharacterized protein (DUF58 family)
VCALGVLATAAIYAFTGTDAALLLLCASVLLPACGILAAAAARVEVELQLPMGMQKGETGSGKAILKNRTLLPVARAELELYVQNTLTREEKTILLNVPLAPLENKVLPFDFKSVHCGRFRFCCKMLIVEDAFGLVRIKRKTAITIKRLVTPELFPMHVRLTGSETPVGDEDSINLSRKGQDWSEPFQLREYVEGDSLKQIHWKLSQKLDRYIVSDPSQTLDRALLVFWDRGALAENAPPEVPDTLAEAVVSFCLSVIQEEIPYSVAWSRGDGSGCEVREVSSMDDLYGIIPDMLHSPSGTGGVSGIPECVRSLGGKRYPLIAYFSDRVPSELAEFTGTGRATLFICSEGAATGDSGELACWPFSSVDYRQSLRDVTI